MCTGTVEVIVCGRGPVGTSEAYEAANAPRCMVWSLYTGHMRAHVAARARVLATWRIRDLDQECHDRVAANGEANIWAWPGRADVDVELSVGGGYSVKGACM